MSRLVGVSISQRDSLSSFNVRRQSGLCKAMAGDVKDVNHWLESSLLSRQSQLRRSRERFANGRGKRGGVDPLGDMHAIKLVGRPPFPESTTVEDDHWQPTRPTLRYDESRRLGPDRRDDEDIGRLVRRLDRGFVNGAVEAHAVGHAKPPGYRLEFWQIPTVTDDPELRPHR